MNPDDPMREVNWRAACASSFDAPDFGTPAKIFRPKPRTWLWFLQLLDRLPEPERLRFHDLLFPTD